MLKINYVKAPLYSPAHEQWAEVNINSNTQYLISTLGRLYSFAVERLLLGKLTGGSRLLDYIPTMDKSPFPFVRIYREANVRENIYKRTLYNRTTVTFQRLVANTFIPRPKGYNIVVHKNGISTDNCVTNLKWSNYSENIIKNRTSRNKLSEQEVRQIKKLLGKKNRVTIKEIAEKFKVSTMQIFRIQNGDVWGEIPGFKKEKTIPVKFSPKQVKEIRELLLQGKSGVYIAAKLNTNETRISRVKNKSY